MTTFSDQSVRQYEFVHGRRPRGIGNWAFALVAADGARETRFIEGLFSQARKVAMREARAAGCVCVEVLT